MILINDERIGWLTDIGIAQRQIRDTVKKYRKTLDTEVCPSHTQAELLDAIVEGESELQYITEMQKIPFNLLIVIEKEK